jgi:hypothetical protein
MKFIVTMKDPDALHDAVFEAVKTEVGGLELPDEEKELIKEARFKKVYELCGKWFEYGEYLRVEIDTESKTCTVQLNNTNS